MLDSHPNESGTQAAQRIAAYIFQHTQASVWNPLNNPSNTACHSTDPHEPDLTGATCTSVKANVI